MSAKNASKQLGIGLVGALLAAGLLLAACAVPDGRAHDARDPGAAREAGEEPPKVGG
ncbi:MULTISPECIES: hypothetical protein [unclassified Streptomyces]|uniref:hypothetical protein n=1 Tax=unclassified Streptomyces TaxID=2593676 RepID=UPI0022547F31|nr:MULTISPECIES: hypothetical protein [unclassified Streptomyces]MCX4528870.1 hypothetical protein [Streptomyces sp. NBC_01551]MCX4540522.1 hypothetical protein [Streptomyces sp. NBC_01565]